VKRPRRLIGIGRRVVLKARYGVERLNQRIRERFHSGDPSVGFERVHRRLELLLTAVYGRPIAIRSVEENQWTRERVRNLASRDARKRELACASDGEAIYLPPHLSAESGDENAIARYRLFALEQAERITRGTIALAPTEDRLERDLYLLREGAAIDAHIARAHPGVAAVLRDERSYALGRRPELEALTEAERDVELRLRNTLKAHPDANDAVSSDPTASLAWARETAKDIRARGDYRGLQLASIWGTVRNTDDSRASTNTQPESRHHKRRGDTGVVLYESTSGESPDGAGTSPDAKHKKQQSADEGTSERDDQSQRPDGTGAGDVRRGGIVPDDTFVAADPTELAGLPPAVYYDEWRYDTGSYVKRGAAVRLYDSAEGDADWSRMMLDRHAATVRNVRHQFERLRARRSLLARQRAGDELDIAACVNAIVDRRIGQAPDDRLYVDARPARRGLAISLLVDASGSTEQRVTEELRIIDLERIALLLASEALDALGDLYAVYAFAGKNSYNVKVTTLKDFGERKRDAMHRRVSALHPGGFTRLGAAVRHATHRLARQSAGHRLLLILSDGRPNDVDRYQGNYGVEDSRQAIMEARASGVYPFCLTVDRDASEYLPRIFGKAGHTILQRPEQLPTALLRVVQALIGRG
jgi:nitric oxide reductase NorD protein